MVFNHTLLVFLLRIVKICTENGQINTTKTGLNKDLVLDDSPLPLWSKSILSRFLILGPFPYFHSLFSLLVDSRILFTPLWLASHHHFTC